jgi:hypothetical protein
MAWCYARPARGYDGQHPYAACSGHGGAAWPANVLLVNGLDTASGKKLFDHVWIETGRWTRLLKERGHEVRPGTVIEFSARADLNGKDWRLIAPVNPVVL